MTSNLLVTTLRTLSIGLPTRLGALTMFPLYRHDPAVPDVLPAATALADGLIDVEELPGASVPTLAVVSHAEGLVFVPAGQVVLGGFQDRMVIETTVLEPGESTIPVACVEAGRWGGTASFDRRTALGARSVRRHAVIGRSAHDVDQGTVWRLVDGVLDDAGTPHASRSMRAAFDRDDSRAQIISARGALPGQCGVAVGRGDDVLGVELFADRDVLAAYWDAIVRSYVLDDIGAYAGRPSTGRVLRFIRHAGEALALASTDTRVARYRLTSAAANADALTIDDVLVHLTVLAG